jgi:hypothetical protein
VLLPQQHATFPAHMLRKRLSAKEDTCLAHALCATPENKTAHRSVAHRRIGHAGDVLRAPRCCRQP